ncbi:MAG: PEPxxWA-CTERM sorting domain-containing protein [Thermaurantiacus sp.]
MRMKLVAGALATALVAGTANAGTVSISGTRANISPGGIPGGRCAPAVTVGFAPGAFLAEGAGTLGSFTYTASHCIAAPPPGTYYVGLFEWVVAGGTLFGTYGGELFDAGVPGTFDIAESIPFAGGTGIYSGWTGFATAVGSVRFGEFEGQCASFGDATFSGELTMVPEPLSWAMMIAGFGLVGFAARRRRAVALA